MGSVSSGCLDKYRPKRYRASASLAAELHSISSPLGLIKIVSNQPGANSAASSITFFPPWMYSLRLIVLIAVSPFGLPSSAPGGHSRRTPCGVSA